MKSLFIQTMSVYQDGQALVTLSLIPISGLGAYKITGGSNGGFSFFEDLDIFKILSILAKIFKELKIVDKLIKKIKKVVDIFKNIIEIMEECNGLGLALTLSVYILSTITLGYLAATVTAYAVSLSASCGKAALLCGIVIGLVVGSYVGEFVANILSFLKENLIKAFCPQYTRRANLSSEELRFYV